MLKNTIFLTALILTSTFSFAQKTDFPFNKHLIPIVDSQVVYEKVDTLQGLSKDDIFSGINSWIALTFLNSKAVTQLSDRTSGKIIVKANYRDFFNFSVLGSNTPYYYRLDYTMDITVKDSKYRCIIIPSTVAMEGGQSWPILTLYSRIPDEYDFKKLGSAKRSEMYRAKQILNNTDVFAKASFQSIRKQIVTPAHSTTNDF